MVLKLDNIELPSPNGFRIDHTNIERRQETASGLLVVDVIRKKKNFTLTYYELTATELKILLDAFEVSTFKVFSYPEMGATVTATVWITALPRELVYEDPEDWQNITISMEEQ